MQTFRRFLISLLTGTILLSPSFTLAQDSFFDIFTELSLEAQKPPQPDVDSFFDIFTELSSVSDAQCDPCKVLAQEIADMQMRIDGLNNELSFIDSALNMVDDAIQAGVEEMEDMEKQLEEIKNPKNFIESDGRRYDSSDNAALRRRNANLWKAYKGGRMTAQEYSDEVGKPFDDPEVAKDLEMLKEIIKDELQDSIDTMNRAIDKAKEARSDLNKQGQELTEKLDALMAELEKLKEQLKDCNKRCKEETVNIPEDYGIGQDEQSLWEKATSLFNNLFGNNFEIVNPFAGLQEFLNGLEGNGDGSGGIPTEMVSLDLMGGPSQVDSFFDVFFDIDLPPVVCHLCDPIREQIEETQNSLNDLQREQALLDAEVKQAYNDLAVARDAKSQAENALDAINNPRSSAESNGRRMDSSDQAAMRARNSRLWGDYKSGDLSAQELEAEWSKPFDDPSVKRELDAIKQKMKDDLQDIIDAAQKAIDNLNDKITKNNDRLIDLAGSIAAHRAVMEFLRRDLAECEKKCRLQPDAPSIDLTGWDAFIFPRQIDEGGAASSQASSSADDEEDPHELGDGESILGGSDQGFLCRTTGLFCDEMKEDNKVAVSEGDGFLCDWFGIFCPKGMMIGGLVDCVEGKGNIESCNRDFDADGNGVVDAADLQDFKISLQGPNGYSVPLQIQGMDGNDQLSVDDLRLFGGCLQNGGQSCSGLDVGNPPDNLFGTLPPSDILGLRPNDMGLHMINGNDTLLGDPITPNFFGNDGGLFDGGPNPPPLPPDFFGPGSDPFGGNLQLLGPGGDAIPNPPPVPPSTEQQVVQRLIDEVKARLKNEPLGPCEKFVMTIIRQRIGNTTRYIARVTKVRDDAKCPPTSSESSGCQSDADCDDGDECTADRCDVETRECTHSEIKGCRDDEEIECPDFSYTSRASCSEVCTQGECQPQGIGNKECWFCADKRLQCPSGQVDTKSICDLSCSASEGICVLDSKSGCYACRQPTGVRSSSSLPRTTVQCDSPTMPEADCKRSCSGTCSESYQDLASGLRCFTCRPSTVPASSTPSASLKCDPPSETESECRKDCFGTCNKTYTRSDGVKCFECVPEAAVSSASSSSSRPQTGPTCPSGTTSDIGTCESQCGPQGGTCSAQNGCYSCTVVSCPSGTYKNECPGSCSNGCDIAAQQSGVTCYKCKQDCETVCAQNNYGGPNTDHSNAILAELQGYSCVSGASVSIQTATIGSCSCVGNYSITVNQIPPVCKGTACGDVVCGGSASCPGGPNETITVRCNWGGWEKIQKHQFRPILGN